MSQKEPTRAELIETARDMGIVDVPKKATKEQISGLIASKRAETGQEPSGSAGVAPASGGRTVACAPYRAVRLRTGPSTSAPVVREMENGSEVAVESLDGEWAKVDGGFVMAKYLV